MPSLTDVDLPKAFLNSVSCTFHSCFLSPSSHIDIGALGGTPNIPYHNPSATVTTLQEFTALELAVTEIILDNACCNDESFLVMDFGCFRSVRRIVVGNISCFCVDEVKLIGLKELESVVIGENSFTKEKSGWGEDPNRHFYLKNCPKLKELRIGRFSFSDYTVCEIENVDALEVIEMGELGKDSWNFFYCSVFELKSA